MSGDFSLRITTTNIIDAVFMYNSSPDLLCGQRNRPSMMISVMLIPGRYVCAAYLRFDKHYQLLTLAVPAIDEMMLCWRNEYTLYPVCV